MPSIKFASQFYNQLGLKSWEIRAPFKARRLVTTEVQETSSPINVEDADEHVVDDAVETCKFEASEVTAGQLDNSQPDQQNVQPVSDSTANIAVNDVVVPEEQQAPVFKKPQVEASKSFQENALVLLGRGLDSIWENENEPAWRLWQNIVMAFEWQDKNVMFYDLDCLVSEDALFNTMEEVIDLSVEWVLSMEAEHVLSEQLAEGIQVIEVPDLESMLGDPYAKQMFYQSVLQNAKI